MILLSILFFISGFSIGLITGELIMIKYIKGILKEEHDNTN